MKFQIDKQAFLVALARCTAVTDPHSPDTRYKMVCIEAFDPVLRVRSMTEVRSVACPLEAQIQENGGLCVDSKEFYERIKLLPEGMVSVTTSGVKLTAKTLKAARQFTLTGIPTERYPVNPARHERLNELETTTHTLAQLISAAAHAVAHDAGQPTLHSLCLESREGILTAVGFDGQRAASANTGDTSNGIQWLLPAPAAADLRRLCDTKADEPVTLFESAGSVFAEFNDFEYATKQSMGTYPPWRMVVPKSSERSVTVDRRALVDGLRAVSRASGPFGGVRFIFGKGLRLEAASADAGESSDELECEETSPATIGLSAQYMLDALSVLGVDQVMLSCSGKADPFLITVPGDSHFLAVVSPMELA